MRSLRGGDLTDTNLDIADWVGDAWHPEVNESPRHHNKRIEADGWAQVSQEGSHRQYKHPAKKGRVTVAGKPGSEPPK